MFLSPFFDLWNQIDRDVGGVGFGFDLPGEVMAEMFLAFGTTAIGVAASTTDGHEAGGQNWAFGLKLLLAGLEEAADESGVFGYFHRFSRRILRPSY